MKFLWSFLFLIFFSCNAMDYSIVFVHVGPQLPDYFFDALIQARRFNDPDHAAIIALIEKRALQDEHLDVCKQYDIDLIFCDDLEKSKDHIDFNRKSTLNRKALNGFWFYTTERFFYLDELMQQHKLDNVFHLESDNMLYADLNEMLPIFKEKYQNIAAVFDCDTRCIPSFMYFAHCDSLHLLIKFISRIASLGNNDMETLAKFKQRNTPDIIDHLPLIMPEYIAKYGLRNDLGKCSKYPERYTNHFELFNSIFDAAAIGQYLGGTSADSGGKKHGFINETCLFNPSKMLFEWHLDNQGRKVPHAVMDDKTYRINNLHIHCKNLKAFTSFND